MTETTGSTATPERGRPGEEQSELPSRRDRKRASKQKKGLFARLALFYRQIIAELRKVVWPTRNDLVTYTTVVIAFVVVIMLLVSGLDWSFAKLSFWIFG
ncbi:preprotein translocase subunit SecE [Streptacidiphilus sp. ASG 303]|uniref:preprotein translocase subunit SecE n=1 Tax=Streptomycetaceae TaxID=2062 RepID=UPI001E2A3BDF|nr:preprotein translocase subunit SecE [Streptacidiphilus sp. ASG 303]MCD0482013.1 preprotein translocase subunit SecE [Streptacidiphilus sp. ASG 303]